MEESRSKIRNDSLLEGTNLEIIQCYKDKKFYSQEELLFIIDSFFLFSIETQELLFSKLNSIIFDPSNDISIIRKTLNSISSLINNDLFFERVNNSIDFFPRYLEFLITELMQGNISRNTIRFTSFLCHKDKVIFSSI